MIAEYFGCIAFTQGKKIIVFGDGEFVNLAIDMAKRFEFEMEIEVQKFKRSANYLASKRLASNSLVITNSFRNGYCSKVIERLFGFIEARQQNCQKSTGTDLSNSLGFTTEGILRANASKLFDRMARGKKHGSGDER